MVIIFIVMLVYIIILQKRVRQVNHQEKMRENRRCRITIHMLQLNI